MAKKSRGELIPKSPLKNLKKDAAESKKLIEQLTTTVLLLVEAAKKLKLDIPKALPTGGGAGGGRKPPSVKGIAEFNKLTKQSNEIAQTKIGIDKKLLKEKELLKQMTQEQNKAIKDEIALAKTQKGSLARLRLESKKLRDEKERLNITTAKGKKRLHQINLELNKNNAILEKNATKLGKQKIGIGRYEKALGGLRRALGQLGLAFGVFTLIKDSFNVIKNFEQAEANLASVLGVTTDQMAALTKQQKELGATTRFTAAEVANLQTELAKLGFTQGQIQDMTPAVLALAEATGVDLANAAAVAGATLNGFGLSSKDTQQVVDTMAKAFSTSSLDMEKFKVAMASVAPVAKNAGFTIEETTALLGTMTDRGIDASAAGTGLRNMFLDSGKAGLTLEEALVEINGASDKTAKSFELFGKRGATLGVILAENQEATQAQTDALNENTEASLRGESAAAQMADTQRNTLGGALDLLRSAWEGLILSMDEAGGIGESLRKGIGFLAANLGTIVMVLGKAIRAFIVFKTVMFALKMRQQFKDFKAVGGSLKTLGKNLDGASEGARKFGKNLKSIGVGIAVGLFTELAAALWDIVSGASRAADEINRLKDIREDGENAVKFFNKAFKKTIEANNELRKEAIQLAKEKREEDIKNGVSSVKAFEDEAKAIKAANAEFFLFARGKKDPLGRNLIEAQRIQIENMRQILEQEEQQLFIDKQQKNESNRRIDVFKTKERIANLKNEIRLLASEIALRRDSILAVLDENKAKEPVTPLKPTGDSKKAKELNTELAERNELLSRQLELLQMLDQIEFRSRANEVQERIDEGVANLLSIDMIRKMVDEKNAILREAAISRRDFEIATITETNRVESEVELNKIKDNADKLLAQKGLSKDQKADIESQYQTQLDKFALDELQRAADLELEIRGIKKLTDEELLALKKANGEELNAINDELLAAQIKADEKLKEKEKDDFAERLENQNKFLQATENAIIASIDKRIKKVEEESTAAQKQFDHFSRLAESGVVKAEQSLAEEQKIIDAAALEKERLEKRKQDILLVSAVLQAYNSNLAAGDDSNKAFAKAITTQEVLTQFISRISGFFDGTEDTGDQGIFRDNHGVITGYTHKNERVITAKDNARIGGASNEEVARTMEAARLGKLNDGVQLAINDNGELVEQMKANTSEISALKKVMIDKGESYTETGQLISDVFAFRDTVTKGGKTTQRTYRVEQ